MTTTIPVPTGVTLGADGATFEVWAPFARSVAVMGDWNNWSDAANPLSGNSDGIWRGSVTGVAIGQQYKFCLIDQAGNHLHKNDPRALQLTTTGDNAIIVDPAFDWQNDDFRLGPANQQVIYELHIGTFNRPDPSTSGSFDSALEKLDHLTSLGVTAIELMPCSENWMDRWWGYTPDYPYAVESAYGGRHAFMRFVREAHKRGLGVILDVVYNHLSPDPGLDLWRFDGWSENGRGGIYFYNDWRAVTPWGDTRLDYGRPEVRDYIVNNARMWLRDCHVDGLRVDSTHYIRSVVGRDNDPATAIREGWQLLQALTDAARQERPGALLIAEDVATNPAITMPTSQQGLGFTAQWDTPLPFTLRDVLGALNDQNRQISRLSQALQATIGSNPFGRVIYSESHDADANGRARLNEEIAPGDAEGLFARRRSCLAAALILTAPGIPMLFQGQEFMETGSFSNWRALDWHKADSQQGIIQLYRDLVSARLNRQGNTAGLLGGNLAILHCDESSNLLVYHRWHEGGPGDDVVIALNFSNQPLEGVSLPFPRDGVWQVRLNSDWRGYSSDFTDTSSVAVEAANGQATANLGPYSFLMFSQDPSGGVS